MEDRGEEIGTEIGKGEGSPETTGTGGTETRGTRAGGTTATAKEGDDGGENHGSARIEDLYCLQFGLRHKRLGAIIIFSRRILQTQ